MSRFGCAICSEVLDENQDISATKCGHVFHGRCLQQWLASNATCPHCRTSIRLARDVIAKIFFTNHDDTVCMTPSSNSRSNDEISKVKEKCRQLKLQKAELKDEIKNLQGQLKIANAVSASLEAETRNQEAINKTLKLELKSKESELRKAQKQNGTTSTENAKLRSSLNELQHLKIILTGKEEEVNALLKSYGVIHADNQPAVQMAQYCAELKSQLQSQMIEKSRLMKQMNLAYQQKTSSENEVIALKGKINKLNEKFEQMGPPTFAKINAKLKRNSALRFNYDDPTLNFLHLSPRQGNSSIASSEDADISDSLVYSQEESKSDTACALVKPSKSSYNYKVPVLSSNGGNTTSSTQTYEEYKIFKKTGLGKAGAVKKPRMDEFYNGLGGHSGPSDFDIFKKRTASPNLVRKSVKPDKTSVLPWLMAATTIIHVSDSDTD